MNDQFGCIGENFINNLMTYITPQNSYLIYNLIDTIRNTYTNNPYKANNPIIVKYHQMWSEQCTINFPLLYMSSLNLYLYAKKHKCDTFLFATRDCCHWIKIFQKLFPKTNCHYFNCSRIMCKTAVNQVRPHYKQYIESLIKGHVDKTIYVDIHGTGCNVLSYFQKEFNRLPRCYIISSGVNNYTQLPLICHYPYEHQKLVIPLFSVSGTPIEMLNYDIIGTLCDYTVAGPIRNCVEYNIKHLEPYHKCMKIMIDMIVPIRHKKDIRHIDVNWSNIYSPILNGSIILRQFINHQTNHTRMTIKK